jgi:hypothetical protein
MMIIIDDIHGIRLRMPSLRLSATFSKTADSDKKKKNPRRELRDETIRSQVQPTEKDNEL